MDREVIRNALRSAVIYSAPYVPERDTADDSWLRGFNQGRLSGVALMLSDVYSEELTRFGTEHAHARIRAARAMQARKKHRAAMVTAP